MTSFRASRPLVSSVVLASVVLASVVLLFPTPASAVLVAGANGGGNTTNNSDAASLDTWLASQGQPAFSYWDSVTAYSTGNATYLGTPYGWVLTANHVAAAATVTFQGTTYDVVESSRQQVGIADLQLFRVTHATEPLPTLPDVPLDAVTPGVGSELLLMGSGRDRQEDAATDPNVSDATVFTPSLEGYTWTGEPRINRWGTNTTIDTDPLPGPPQPTITVNNTVSLVVDFDEPAIGEWLTSNEAQAALNDSGGAVWTLNPSNEWELSGLIFAITNQYMSGTAAFGDSTFISNIATYRDGILAVTAVPEPSAAVLLATAWLPAAARRRRKTAPSPSLPPTGTRRRTGSQSLKTSSKKDFMLAQDRVSASRL